MSKKLTERDLVIKFRDAKEKRDKLRLGLENAQTELNLVEHDLIEILVAQDKKATSRYEGIGFCSLRKPRLYARYDKEQEDVVFSFLEKQGRNDLIKQTVNSQSLSSYVADLIGEGKEIPEFVKYTLVNSARFYPEKK